MWRLTHNYFQDFSINTNAFLWICTVFLVSCAQVVAPGGGKIDKIPPRVVEYKPDSAQLNFNSKTIEINFDEFIQLKDLNNQLIISPPIEKTPEITVKNKTLSLAFDKEDTLKTNTTYFISFGNAVQDIHENNPLENFRYIFSTGSFIDSLTVKGKVQNAFDHTTEKGLLVMLYSDLSDSIVYKKLPEYFTKTKEDGTFQINNIRQGTYKIIALKDANANFKYDGETESIGFIDTLVDPTGKQDIRINSFQETPKKVFLKKHFHPSYGKIILVFNQGSDSIHLTNLSKDTIDVQEFSDFSKNKDTLTFWIKNFERDSLKLQVSNGNKILDTVEFKMIKKEDALNSKRTPLKLSVVSSPNGNQSFDLNADFKLVFNHPLDSVKQESIIELKEDSVLYSDYKKLIFQHSRLRKDVQLIHGVEFATATTKKHSLLKENTNYHLLIPPGTFTDIFGLTNDSVKIDFKTREEKFYGILKLKINLPETKGNYIVQLLDEKGTVIREESIKKSETIDYKYLYPLKYKLKIIYDTNENGKWDSGNYLQKKHAEKVVYNTEAITIRSNWDLDLEWNITNE